MLQFSYSGGNGNTRVVHVLHAWCKLCGYVKRRIHSHCPKALPIAAQKPIRHVLETKGATNRSFSVQVSVGETSMRVWANVECHALSVIDPCCQFGLVWCAG
jgi:hypothetical protein